MKMISVKPAGYRMAGILAASIVATALLSIGVGQTAAKANAPATAQHSSSVTQTVTTPDGPPWG
jgi:hypothetical protein